MFQERLQAHHAAMDFTGAGGRIVTDPREAAEIAHTESRLRPVARAHWAATSSSAAAGCEEAVPTPYQHWFKPGVSRDQASLALLPHRSRDGVFVIRECSRDQGGFVLSFTTQGKVVHAQIVRVGRFAQYFSLSCIRRVGCFANNSLYHISEG
jgi:hypothetical protein